MLRASRERTFIHSRIRTSSTVGHGSGRLCCYQRPSHLRCFRPFLSRGMFRCTRTTSGALHFRPDVDLQHTQRSVSRLVRSTRPGSASSQRPRSDVGYHHHRRCFLTFIGRLLAILDSSARAWTQPTQSPQRLMTATPSVAANPAQASWLQSTRPVRRVAELASLAGISAVAISASAGKLGPCPRCCARDHIAFSSMPATAPSRSMCTLRGKARWRNSGFSRSGSPAAAV